MAQSRHEGDLYVAGALSAAALAVPAGAVSNAAIAPAAGIAATKLQHRNRPVHAQPNTAATTETRVVYHVRGAAATLVAFAAGSIAKAVGDSTVTVNLRKNGATVLTGVITLNSSSVNYVAQAGTLAATALVAGDVLDVVVTATAGTGTLPTGVFCSLTVDEDAE